MNGWQFTYLMIGLFFSLSLFTQVGRVALTDRQIVQAMACSVFLWPVMLWKSMKR